MTDKPRFISDAGGPISMTDERGMVRTIPQYAVWGDTGRNKNEVIEVHEDLEYLKNKYGQDLEVILVKHGARTGNEMDAIAKSIENQKSIIMDRISSGELKDAFDAYDHLASYQESFGIDENDPVLRGVAKWIQDNKSTLFKGSAQTPSWAQRLGASDWHQNPDEEIGSAPTVGTPVEVQDGGKWWPGKVVNTRHDPGDEFYLLEVKYKNQDGVQRDWFRSDRRDEIHIQKRGASEQFDNGYVQGYYYGERPLTEDEQRRPCSEYVLCTMHHLLRRAACV